MKKADFFSRVYEIVLKIPVGRVMTYGQIAAVIGAPGSARRVGQAMYNTPEHLGIPAHRVVGSQGRLAPAHAFGGDGVQRKMLEDEGVSFKQNGYVDIKKSTAILQVI